MFLEIRTEGEDLGKWYRMSKDPDTGKSVDLLIRRLPADIARKLRKQKVKVKGNVTTIDVATEEIRQREEAKHCWTGSRNLSLKAMDQGAVALNAKLCPGLDFQVGKEVCVDANLTDDLKWNLLTSYPEIVAFIRKRAAALQVADDEEEEEAQGN